MSHETPRQRRWPAYATAVALLGYAAGKAVFAAQGRLGFPGGPIPPPSEYERYARELMDVATAQWLAAGTGLLAAAVVLATVLAPGRRIPRWLLLVALGVTFVGVGSGAAIMAVDGFVGIGVGWKWYHGVVGLAAVGLLAVAIWSYIRATARRPHGSSATTEPDQAPPTL